MTAPEITLPGLDLSAEAREYLITKAALSDEYLDSSDIPPIRSTRTISDLKIGTENPWEYRIDQGVNPDGILFAHRQLDGSLRWQWRPDAIPAELEGAVGKYLFVAGESTQYSQLLTADDPDAPVLMIEGTKQAHAVACAIQSSDLDYEVIGFPGCNGWSSSDWTPPVELAAHVDGRAVYVLLDADAATNLSVYMGGKNLAGALGGAESVEFLPCPGGGKTGIDDYMAELKPERRAALITRLIGKASKKPASARPPAKKTPTKTFTDLSGVDVDGLIDAVMGAVPAAEGTDEAHDLIDVPAPQDGGVWLKEGGGVAPATVATAIMGSSHPMMSLADDSLAVYRNGVYERHPRAVSSIVTTLLGDYYSISAEANAMSAIKGLAYTTRRTSKHSPKLPLVNLRNGMLDLRTLELLPHNPKYLSTRQFPVDWEPDAQCPRYEEWLLDRVSAAQVDVAEETVSQFLDPSRTPPKALFLFGPSRSGKSTFLRIAKAIAGGDDEVSGLSLQQLSDDHFAAAELYDRPINICADLPRDHVRDLSVFKRVTGDDPITANKKYGAVFTYRSTALFLFSANAVPTVSGEEISAYLNRLHTVAFPKTYEGHEDPSIEDAILQELPGILARWAKARNRHMANGFSWSPMAPAVWDSFAGKIDRVARFLSAACVIGEPIDREDDYYGTESGSARDEWQVGIPVNLRNLFFAWREWTQGGAGMGFETFTERVKSMPGVIHGLRSPINSGGRVTNVSIKRMDEWTASDDTDDLIEALWPGSTVKEESAAVPDNVIAIGSPKAVKIAEPRGTGFGQPRKEAVGAATSFGASAKAPAKKASTSVQRLPMPAFSEGLKAVMDRVDEVRGDSPNRVRETLDGSRRFSGMSAATTLYIGISIAADQLKAAGGTDSHIAEFSREIKELWRENPTLTDDGHAQK